MSAVHPVSANATQVLKGRYWTNNGGQPPHFDNFALECPRTEQEHYPERTGIGPRLERYCRSLGQQKRLEILPRWLRGRRGASVVRRTPLSTERRISNVKGCEKIIICFDCSPRCQQSLTA